MKKSKFLDILEKHILQPLKDTFLKSESDQKKKYADCIVRNHLGQVLLLHRIYTDDFMSGTWGFPGGHIEPGEDARVAAKRELFEETGLDAEVRFIQTKELDDCIIYYYEAFVITSNKDKEVDNSIVLDADEHRGWEWVDCVQLTTYGTETGFQEQLIANLGDYIADLLFQLTPVTIIEYKGYTNTEEQIANEGTGPDLDEIWEVLQKAFDDNEISAEQYLVAREKYLKLKKAEALETLAKALDNDLITSDQYLDAIKKAELVK